MNKFNHRTAMQENLVIIPQSPRFLFPFLLAVLLPPADSDEDGEQDRARTVRTYFISSSVFCALHYFYVANLV